MPYPNEHSARLQEPGKFNPDTYRRKNDGTIYGRIKVPQTAAVIWGKLKGKDKPSDNPIPQSLRFPVKYWTAEKAKKWLKDNNVKYIRFEPAKKEKKDSAQAEQVSASIYGLIAKLEAQIWAMEPRTLERFFMNLTKQETYLPETVEIAARKQELRIEANTAVIPIKGVLMKELPRAFAFWGIEGTSYTQISRQVKEALANEKVKSILLDVNSPGGTVPGILETTDLIRAARKQKPVTAVIEDIGASGAYWLAAQADQISIEANSEAGSIGVYTVYVDYSKRAEEFGAKVHVIRSGEHKGMGVTGAPISETQIQAIQDIVDGINQNFIESVALGRKKDIKQIKDLATGQLWLAGKARKLGLVDKITRSQAQTINNSIKETSMETEQEQIDAQVELNQAREQARAEERNRLKELTEAFGDDLDFALKAYEQGKTVQEAKAEFCDVLQKRLTEQAEKQGAEPLTGSGSGETGTIDFNKAAKELAKSKGIQLGDAYKEIAREQPEVYEAYKQSLLSVQLRQSG